MSESTFIFDGDCGFCVNSVHWLERRGATKSIEFLPFQSEPAAMVRMGLRAADCREAACIVEFRDGSKPRLCRGAAAINFALRRVPGTGAIGWRLLGLLYQLPIIRQVENTGYSWIARNRHKLGHFGTV